jgi:hypothetical protein
MSLPAFFLDNLSRSKQVFWDSLLPRFHSAAFRHISRWFVIVVWLESSRSLRRREAFEHSTGLNEVIGCGLLGLAYAASKVRFGLVSSGEVKDAIAAIAIATTGAREQDNEEQRRKNLHGSESYTTTEVMAR